MSKKFVFNVPTRQSSGEGRTDINFDEMNEYIVKTVGCSDKPEALIGIVSGVIDLGLQAQDDARMEWKGTPAEKAEIEQKARDGKTKEYFATLDNGKGVMVEYKRWPVKAERCAAIMVDFPTISINRGKFFDEDGVGEELPFRGLLNNEFGVKGIGKTVGKPYSLKEYRDKDKGTWGLKNNTILYKLAQAVNQLDNGNFKPEMLGNLIGEAAMFNVHVHLNQSGDKKFLNEKFAFNGPVPKMMVDMGAVPTLDEKFLHVVNFMGPQDPEVLKTLRQSVINTMKMAEDFAESDLRKALIEIGKIKADDAVGPVAEEKRDAPQASKPQAAPQEPLDFDAFDDDVPF